MMNIASNHSLVKYSFLFAIILSVALACNIPGGIGVNNATPTASEVPPPFLEITVTPRDTNKIIIMNIETDKSMNISKISIILPQQLAGADIYANDVKIDPSITGEKNVDVMLAGMVNAPEVVLVFKSNDQQLASCTIKVSDPMNPVGDCSW